MSRDTSFITDLKQWDLAVGDVVCEECKSSGAVFRRDDGAIFMVWECGAKQFVSPRDVTWRRIALCRRAPIAWPENDQAELIK